MRGHMRHLLLLTLLAGVLLVLPGSRAPRPAPTTPPRLQHSAPLDTRDGDGDGIYCESLPCPCSSGAGSPVPPPPPPPPPASSTSSCTRPAGVQRLRFSAAKYPSIKAHAAGGDRGGWRDPRRQPPRQGRAARPVARRASRPGRGLIVTSTRRRSGRRARTAQRGLVRGHNPIGWLADVMYVPSSENRSHGACWATSCAASATARAFATPSAERGRPRGTPAASQAVRCARMGGVTRDGLPGDPRAVGAPAAAVEALRPGIAAAARRRGLRVGARRRVRRRPLPRDRGGPRARTPRTRADRARRDRRVRPRAVAGHARARAAARPRR